MDNHAKEGPSSSSIKQSPKYRRVLLMRTLGNFLILSSLFMIIKTFYNPVMEEARFFVGRFSNTAYVLEEDINDPFYKDYTRNGSSGLLGQVFDRNRVEVLHPENPDFGIVIPKINANTSVIKDVDPSNKNVYLSALQNGVAHARGTAYPGEDQHIFLFAHSTDTIWNVGRYNAIFYLLYKLEKGDEVDLFYEGKRHKYEVIGERVVNPDEVQYLTHESDRELLTLQTCWPPGTTFQRLLIFAQPVVVD